MTPSVLRSRLITAALVAAGAAAAWLALRAADPAAVLATLRRVGPLGFAAVAAAQLVLYVPLAAAWRLATPAGGRRRRLAPFVWGSLTAEAAANLLPFSQLGGVLAGSRMAELRGLEAADALGSNLVDVTMELAAQLVYVLVGAALLARRLGLGGGADPLLAPVAAGLAAAALLVAGFVVSQRRLVGPVVGLVRRLLPAADGRATAVGEAIEAAYARPGRLWACLALHVLAWFATAGGAWLILQLVRRPLPIGSVVAIDSLVFGLRNAAFFVPGGLGVQEGAYALLGPLFGLPAEAALALSLLKRARDAAIGLPVLAAWQVLELRRRLGRD